MPFADRQEAGRRLAIQLMVGDYQRPVGKFGLLGAQVTG